MIPEIKGVITAGTFGLCRILTECTAFQRRVGASGQYDAEKYVRRWEFRESPELFKAARPFAAIWPATRFELEQFAGGEANWLTGRGEVVLYLTDADRIPKAGRSESGDEFAGWLDELIAEIAAKAGVDDRLPIRRISALMPIRHSSASSEKTEGSSWDVYLLVEWK